MSARNSHRSASAWAVLAESDSDDDRSSAEPSSFARRADSDAPAAPVVASSPPGMQVAAKKTAPKKSAKTDRVSSKSAAAATTESVGFQGDMDAILTAMAEGTQTWGDLMSERLPGVVESVAVAAPAVHRSNTWDDFWALPFTAGLRELWGDCYDCTSLSDPEWEELMRWLFDAGWDVGSYDRNGVEFELDNGPRRVWVPPSELEAMMEEEAALRRRRDRHCGGHGHGHSHAAPAAHPKPAAAAPAKEGRKKSGTVPRFCREAEACKEEGCRYVHGDTIPRVNRPCGFGTDCGKGDAAKRALCLYMHPGEEWVEGLVIRRPAPAAAANASADSRTTATTE